MLTKKFRLGELDEAAALLRRGELVAFPTETVYGLGAIATKEQAVAKVFQAKGRPSDNPLIVHVKDAQQVFDYAAEVPELAKELMERFWPGPLTIILPVKPGVFPANVNNDQETQANRPAHRARPELPGRPGPAKAPAPVPARSPFLAMAGPDATASGPV